MTTYFSKKYNAWFNGLGAYQFFGGLLGLGFTGYAIYNNGIHSIPVFAIFTLFFLFNAFSMVCGWFCLRQKEMALSLSYINQCLQLISFAAGGYAYGYVAGLYLALNFDFLNGLKINFPFGLSGMQLRFNVESDALSFGINIIAIVMILIIDRLQKNVRDEQLVASAEEIVIEEDGNRN